MPNAPSPYLPPASPNVLPGSPFDQLLGAYGTQLQWAKGHQCPCVMGNTEVPGSPDPGCTSCGGRGVYWDPFTAPFFGLLTHIGRTNFGPEPGSRTNTTEGGVWTANPVITVPASAGVVWSEATVMDAFLQVQAPQRFNTTLVVGQDMTLPYQQSLVLASSGAVRVYDSQTHSVVENVGYTVSSGVVTLTDPQYGPGTAYTVEYQAAPVFIVFRESGGAPHYRPLGAMGAQLPLRLHCQLLDLWTRTRNGASPFSPQALPGGE